MTYHLAVDWHHEFDDEPVRIFSEIADNGVEVRKMEQYRDGRIDFADDGCATGSTFLGDDAVPSLEEINEQAEFDATYIGAEDFESLWRTATESRCGGGTATGV